ncbi:MAG: response regulator [Spirulina sp. SIO3F2]|nr:response regulator [Spirulina sp. SIO3F2]
MSQYPFKLSHQFSYVAVVAVGVIVAIAGLNFWEQAQTNQLIVQQTKLLQLKKHLSQLERTTLNARLDEVQMLNTHNLSWYERFEENMAQANVWADKLTANTTAQGTIGEDLNVLRKTLERYATSVERTYAVKQKMGLGMETGILDQIDALEAPIQAELNATNKAPLMVQFVSLQVLENDFSTTLNMKLATQLRTEIDQLQQQIQAAALPPIVKQQLLANLQAYQQAIAQLLDRTVELELVSAENTLQYDRIAPRLSDCQTKVNQLLSLNTQQLYRQRQISQFRTIGVFLVAVLILLLLMAVQLRAAHRLVSRLQQLALQMGAMRQGQVVAQQELPRGSDEIGRLATTFLDMSNHIHDQMEVIQQEREKSDVANKAKSTFLARMSHELRTPLNAILGFAQLLGRDENLLPQHHEQVNIIRRSGEHLLSLINDVLDMAKIEAGRMELEPEHFRLADFIKTITEMFSLKAQSQGLALLGPKLEALPDTICADEGKLRQVLINLLGNAFKFTEEGHVRLGMEISPLDDAQVWLKCAVEDTGAGIAPEELSKLFEAFTQTETGRRSGQGTGLGLSISRQFVELMGGELNVQSQVGSGTRFSFTIPIEVIDATPIQNIPRLPEVKTLVPGQPDYRILVVEDKDYNQRLMVQLLGDVGFSVQIANDGLEGIEQWQAWRPHLIWMDIQMPHMDGFEATGKIRALEQEQGLTPTVIIALTASVMKSEHTRILDVGCDDIVGKPFQAHELLAKIKDYLDVDYRYVESETVMSPIAAEPELNLAQLLQPQPTEWLWDVHNATLEADADKVLALLADLPPEQVDLQTTIAALIENFDFETLIDATSAAIAETVNSSV